MTGESNVIGKIDIDGNIETFRDIQKMKDLEPEWLEVLHKPASIQTPLERAKEATIENDDWNADFLGDLTTYPDFKAVIRKLATNKEDSIDSVKLRASLKDITKRAFNDFTSKVQDKFETFDDMELIVDQEER